MSFCTAEELTALPQIPYLDLRSHFDERGMKRREGKGKEGKRREVEKYTRNKCLVMALHCSTRES